MIKKSSQVFQSLARFRDGTSIAPMCLYGFGGELGI